MRLKRLEIYGFKSFADRTVVVFDEGITGIVGPNGSGKSNLSDAVRWVLGEQSAKALRGGKMEDVIFNGTQKRKRMGYCEVSLVFDNEDHALSVDYTEVMITRRVYRSGEGEYYINKSACRLKDIVELFRDTGVGKEGYSIIGQGRIDEILSQKSEDRRGVFEEAAGIVKYRTRKEESEKRLSNMRDNLSRVEDIIAELESQLEPLEKASETARRYLNLRDELRVLECSAFVLRSDRAKERIAEAEQLLTGLKEAIASEEKRADALSEQREKANVVGKITAIGEVKDRNIIIMDDMIDTAGTITKAADMFMELGASSVRAAVTHPVLSGPAYDRINNSALSEVIVTDTIPLKKDEDTSKFTVLTVADIFADVIERVHDYREISSKFIF